MEITFLGTSHGDPEVDRHCSSTLYRIGDIGYLIDAGSPVRASLVRDGMDFDKLRTIFISHMHVDHFGGLVDVMANQQKYNHRTTIYLPEPQAEGAIRAYADLGHRLDAEEMITFQGVTPGEFYQDDLLKVTAVPTQHLQNEHVNAPSFAYILEDGQHRVLHTGDLRCDFSDFPYQHCLPGTICICELTHYRIEDHLEKLAALPLKRMIFNHVGPGYRGEKGLKRFNDFAKQVPYPCHVATDMERIKL